MYQQTARLSPTEVLQLEWGANYTDFRIYLHGQLVGSSPDKESLKLSKTFALPGDDPRKITVLLADGGLEIWHNGVELRSGAKNGEKDHFMGATNYLIGYGVLQLVFGLILAAVAGQEDPDVRNLSFALVTLFSGILIGLGYWARKTSTTLPLTIASVLLILSVIGTLALGQATGLFLTALMIYYLYKGIRAGPINKPGPDVFDGDGPLDAGV